MEINEEGEGLLSSGSMSEISYIVNSLNSPPFNRGLRVVEFHDKSPRELQLELGEGR